MKQSFLLVRSGPGDVSLRTIIASDCGSLRQWKNAHRFAFFFQEIITPEQQEEWFRGYWERIDDYMFIVQHRGEGIGCMAFRLIHGQADIYNVILGNPELGRKGLMSKAMRLLCSYILSNFTHDIGLKVLRSNPARHWYLENGFREVAAREMFLELKLDQARFKPCEFQRSLYRASDLSEMRNIE